MKRRFTRHPFVWFLSGIACAAIMATGCATEVAGAECDEGDEACLDQIDVASYPDDGSTAGVVYVYQANVHRFLDDADDLINRMKYAYQSSERLPYLPDVIILQQVTDKNETPFDTDYRDPDSDYAWNRFDTFVRKLESALGTSYSVARNAGHRGAASKAILWRSSRFSNAQRTPVTSYEIDSSGRCLEGRSNLGVRLTDDSDGRTIGVASIWTAGAARQTDGTYVGWNDDLPFEKDGCAFMNVRAAWNALSFTNRRIIAGDQNITPQVGSDPSCSGSACRCWYRNTRGWASGDDPECQYAGTEWRGAETSVNLDDAMAESGADDMGGTSHDGDRIDYLFYDANGFSFLDHGAYRSGTLGGMDHNGNGEDYSDHAALRAALY